MFHNVFKKFEETLIIVCLYAYFNTYIISCLMYRYKAITVNTTSHLLCKLFNNLINYIVYIIIVIVYQSQLV